ncbi:MAG TPA: phosphoglucosamine mutase, partial [Planctomycetota bacterium]|nr:phosphoglucosamine mutase [Planctomycetota bacterium]
MSEGALFGTDGVRDRAGEGLLAPRSVRRLVRAIVRVLADRSRISEGEFPSERGNTVFIGRDTRRSGSDLLDLVSSDLCASGWDVADLGVLPTPGVAHAASTSPECGLAIVLSASHNPAEYNGIKLIAPIGAKVSPDFEAAVTREYLALDEDDSPPSATRRGKVAERSKEMS